MDSIFLQSDGVSTEVRAVQIEARKFDLKAINPNAKADEDGRTPEELIDLIEAKGREVTESLATLRILLVEASDRPEALPGESEPD